jgi:hypothetical protein
MVAATIWYDRLRGLYASQDGTPVSGAGRVAWLNFINSVLAYNAATGVLDITVGVGDLSIVALTGAANTLALVQAHKLVTVSHGSATALTVPPNSGVAFPVGTRILVAQVGAGQLTITAGVGVTVRTPSSLKARAQWSLLCLIKIATNEWIIDGDLEEATAAGEFQKATSILEGLPYALSSDPSVPPVLSLTFGPAVTGDVFLLEFYAEIANQNASPRNVHGSILIDGVSTQDSSAIQFAAAGDVGCIQPFVMRIAVPLADDSATPTFAARIYASDSDVIGPQVCFSATKLGQ